MPGSSFDLDRIGVDDGGGSGPVEENMNTVLGFLVEGAFVGERAKAVELRGPHTTSSRGQGGSRAWGWCGPLGLRLRHLFGALERSQIKTDF